MELTSIPSVALAVLCAAIALGCSSAPPTPSATEAPAAVPQPRDPFAPERPPKELELLMPTKATAAPGAPGSQGVRGLSAPEAVRAANDRLRQLLGNRGFGSKDQVDKTEQDLAREVAALIDGGLAGQSVLSDSWDKLAADKRTGIATSFQPLVEKEYLAHLKRYLANVVEYVNKAEADGADARVLTLIHAKRRGKPITISVEYMAREVDGQWRVFDVFTDNASMLQSYRDISVKGGVDGFIARLKPKAGKGR